MPSAAGEGAALRVVFLGNAAWSVPSLEAVAASRHPVALVVTRPPVPAGRGGNPRPTPVAEAAATLGLPVAEHARVSEGPGYRAVVEAAPDALVVVAHGEILTPAVLAIPRLAPLNVHFSLLPDLRGAAPVQRAILEGRAETGASVMRMTAGLDEGPVLLEEAFPIEADEDAGALGARLAALGGRLLVRALDGLAAGTALERPQDGDRATFAPKLSREDERIDWGEPAEAIARRVRALSPTPGAWTTFRGRRLKVYRTSVADGGASRPPAGGELVVFEGRPAVATEPGRLVVLEEVGPEGRGRMSGASFARGARIGQGERVE